MGFFYPLYAYLFFATVCLFVNKVDKRIGLCASNLGSFSAPTVYNYLSFYLLSVLTRILTLINLGFSFLFSEIFTSVAGDPHLTDCHLTVTERISFVFSTAILCLSDATKKSDATVSLI